MNYADHGWYCCDCGGIIQYTNNDQCVFERGEWKNRCLDCAEEARLPNLGVNVCRTCDLAIRDFGDHDCDIYVVENANMDMYPLFTPAIGTCDHCGDDIHVYWGSISLKHGEFWCVDCIINIPWDRLHVTEYDKKIHDSMMKSSAGVRRFLMDSIVIGDDGWHTWHCDVCCEDISCTNADYIVGKCYTDYEHRCLDCLEKERPWVGKRCRCECCTDTDGEFEYGMVPCSRPDCCKNPKSKSYRPRDYSTMYLCDHCGDEIGLFHAHESVTHGEFWCDDCQNRNTWAERKTRAEVYEWRDEYHRALTGGN